MPLAISINRNGNALFYLVYSNLVHIISFVWISRARAFPTGQRPEGNRSPLCVTYSAHVICPPYTVFRHVVLSGWVCILSYGLEYRSSSTSFYFRKARSVLNINRAVICHKVHLSSSSLSLSALYQTPTRAIWSISEYQTPLEAWRSGVCISAEARLLCPANRKANHESNAPEDECRSCLLQCDGCVSGRPDRRDVDNDRVRRQLWTNSGWFR